MALNIDFDSFGYLLSSDLETMSPKHKLQSSASPIGSESSSGISSLDSDDLKKQLSSPTISQDDDDQQSNGTTGTAEKFPEEDDIKDDGSQASKEQEKVEAQKIVVEAPVTIVYQNRDILNLAQNVFGSGQLVKYTVLPENNLTCFFQNRAQYYRLSNTERSEYPVEKCSCCDFTYPSTQQINQGPVVDEKNAITDYLKKFFNVNSDQPREVSPILPRRIMNNNTPYGYLMQQPQIMHPQSNGFYNNANYNQSMNPFMNNGSGYGTTLALLNLMNNATRNTATNFQPISNGANNNPRYYNNNMNNNFSMYKQF